MTDLIAMRKENAIYMSHIIFLITDYYEYGLQGFLTVLTRDGLRYEFLAVVAFALSVRKITNF